MRIVWLYDNIFLFVMLYGVMIRLQGDKLVTGVSRTTGLFN